MNAKSGNIYLKIVPVMLAFFVMGFVDLVGIATNYVKSDFALSDTVANLLPSMVFFWFFIFSVPTSLMMNRIGQRKTVVVSLAVTALALMLPLFGYSFGIMLASFCLLGIGNTLMQVSVNPLLSNLVDEKRLASNLTLGQFVKAIASFIAPIIAGWAARQFGDWKLLFPIFMAVSILATFLLGFTRIEEKGQGGKRSSFLDCLKLLGNPVILLCFVSIMCHVGVDVGINVTAPKIIMERTGIPLEEAGFATSIYFLFRLIGCLIGTVALARWSNSRFFAVSVILMVLSMAGFFIFDHIYMLYASIALVGLGNSNIFPITLSKAMLYMPEKKNEISGLMIMGLIGGTIFPLLMGVLSDAFGSQAGALVVISAGVLYLAFFTLKLKTIKA